MGAETFYVTAKGSTSQQAFDSAVDEARYRYGSDGYTGTIAEKGSYVMIDLPAGDNPREFADRLISECDPRIDNKWGPAGCIKISDDEYIFFGWASS
jgi:hypothetical protein